MLDPAFVADEPEALVDEESRDCPGWHSRSPPVPKPPENIPRGNQPVAGACER
jgi:hypothetical protein